MTKRSVPGFTLLLMLLGGCTGESPSLEPAASGESDGTSAVGPEPAPAPDYRLEDELPGDVLPPLEERPGNARWTGDLDEMQARRVIRALVPFNRANYFYLDGKPKGVAVEALQEFERFINKRLNPKDRTGKDRIHIILIPVTHDQILKSLTEGVGDLAIGNLSISDERSTVVDFSAPTYTNVRQWLVSGPSAPPAASLEDLSGKEIWVKASSTHSRHLRQLSDSLVAKGRPAIEIRDVDERLEDDDVLEMVAAGIYDFTVMDSHVAELWAQVFSDLKVHKDVELFRGGQKGWAFRKQSPQLEAAVNDFIRQFGLGTSFGNTVARRYLKNARYAKLAASDQSARQYSKYRQIFNRYAEQYEFPPLLVVAAAYQESGLDPNARNPSGAVGLMQVIPKLAAAKPVSINNVQTVENNVHAGVRMLKFIRDDYLKDEPMDDMNKGLMTLASYNAGPARIRSCRRLAEEMGLDPNVWFRNVELAVAKKVGRETVGYVSNIFKYYLAFRLVEERLDEAGRARQSVTTPGAPPSPNRE